MNPSAGMFYRSRCELRSQSTYQRHEILDTECGRYLKIRGKKELSHLAFA